jgi:hypothetical protein
MADFGPPPITATKLSIVMARRMSTKSPLKLFIHTTSNAAESENVREAITQYARKCSQHIEGQEYLLMHVTKGDAEFYYFRAPNSGPVSDVEFAPLQLAQTQPRE